MMMCLTWPGLDSTINRMVYRAFTPLWAVGMRPRWLVRALITVEMFLMAFFGAVGDIFTVLIFFPWVLAGGWVIIRTIPTWNRINDEVMSTGRLTAATAYQLWIVYAARNSLIGAVIGSTVIDVPLAVIIGSWQWPAFPVGTILLTVSLHLVTMLGRPPRSIQRRAVARLKQIVQVPRLAWG